MLYPHRFRVLALAMRCHRAVVAALGALAATGALANAPQGISAGEMALLPPFCPDTQTFTSQGSPDGPTPRQAEWVRSLGKPFWGMHHYCWALINARRATEAGLTRAQRDHLHRWAIGDVMFVIRMASPEFPLLPEMWHRIGLYQVELGDLARALESFDRSRQAKRDYWPPYLEIARINQRIGRREQALAVLDEGLAAAPGTPQLIEARAQLARAAAAPRRAPARPAETASAGPIASAAASR